MLSDHPLWGRLRGRALMAVTAILGAALLMGWAVLEIALARQADRLGAPSLGVAMARVWRASEQAVSSGTDATLTLMTLHFAGLHFERRALLPDMPAGRHMLLAVEGARSGEAPDIIAVWQEKPLLEDRPVDLSLPGVTLDTALGVLSSRLHQQGVPAWVGLLLPDGQWLWFRSDRYWDGRATPVMLGLAFLLAAALVVGLSVGMGFWLVQPIEKLAARADATRAEAEPMHLPRQGGAEVALLAEVIEEGRSSLRGLLEDRTRMLAAISHDLRTPATRLKLRAEFIEDDELRDKILKDLDEMSEMISSALAFLREDALREAEQLVSFSSILQSLCDDYADAGLPVSLVEAAPLKFETVGTLFGSHREARVFGEQRSLRMRGRAGSLRRAFANLIDNAIKYGTRAEVTVHATSEEVLVEILDDGPGIPEEEMVNVLKPFYRLESSRNRDTGGSGLGLAIVKSIIDLHGGQLELLNRVRGGLRVRVSLPRRL